MRSVTIALHSTLPHTLNPNGARVRGRDGKVTTSRHWSHQADGRRKLRLMTGNACQVYAPGVCFERARVTVTLRAVRDRTLWSLFKAYRPDDPDNLIAACKGLFDGLVDKGIVPDDDAAHLDHGTPIFESVDRVEDEGLSVLVEELES